MQREPIANKPSRGEGLGNAWAGPAAVPHRSHIDQFSLVLDQLTSTAISLS